jgi:large subunit ribosomal protein L17
MRHRNITVKLGRTSAHRDALLAGLVCNLITYKRIQTSLPKAKAARRLAEKMVTLGKRGTLADRRRAISKLHRSECVKTLFEAVAPAFKDRQGGYTRILHLGRRASDSSEMAILEWVNYIPQPPKKKKEKAPAGKAATAPAAAKDKPAEAKKGGKAPAKTEKKAKEKKEKAV